MLVAVVIIAALFAFGVGKQRLGDVFYDYDPLLTAVLIFLLLWFGFVNLFLEAWRRRKSNDYKDNQD